MKNWNKEKADELSELQILSQWLAIVMTEMWLYLTPHWIYVILKENTFFFPEELWCAFLLTDELI